MRSYYNGGVYRLSFKRKNNFMHLAIRRVLVLIQVRRRCAPPQTSTRLILRRGKRTRKAVRGRKRPTPLDRLRWGRFHRSAASVLLSCIHPRFSQG